METYRDQYVEIFRGGRDIVLIAISTDPAEAQGDWAADAEFPFLFASDPDAIVGQRYGAFQPRRSGGMTDNRTLFVVGPDGLIKWVTAPFREIDPTAYDELTAALEEVVPAMSDD